MNYSKSWCALVHLSLAMIHLVHLLTRNLSHPHAESLKGCLSQYSCRTTIIGTAYDGFSCSETKRNERQPQKWIGSTVAYVIPSSFSLFETNSYFILGDILDTCAHNTHGRP
jgi:hypothetical protein